MADRGLFLVDRHAGARGRVRSSLLAMLERLLRGVPEGEWYGRSGEALAADLAARSRQAQVAVADLTWEYLDVALSEVSEPAARGRMRYPDRPRGADPLGVWDRPGKVYRLARTDGEDHAAALDKAVARAVSVAEGDLMLAQRIAAAEHSKAAPTVTGQRRVIHPELSESGVCGLCVAASDRVYRPGRLQPIHDRCKCSTAEVTKAHDPGSSLNNLSLSDLYSSAGSTSAADLKGVRYKVVEHGELGPVLVEQGAKVRTVEDVQRDTGRSMSDREKAERRLAVIERSLADLEARAAAGEDVAAPLDYQRRLRDRLAAQAA